MISIIICSIDANKFSAVCANYRQAFSDEAIEIIGIHDAKSMCEGYNRGARQSRGDVVIFSHDDIEIIGTEAARKLRAHLNHYDLLGIAGTTRLVGPRWVEAGPPFVFGQVAQTSEPDNGYDVAIWNATLPANDTIQALDGVFLCAKRIVVQQVQFDEATFWGFHLYDLDFSFRVYQHGYKLAVINDLPMIHASMGEFGEKWAADAERFVRKHGEALLPKPARSWRCTLVHVDAKEQLLEVMGNSP
jgi:Glycosyltransferase like family